jgi:hypothetical protein
MSQFILDDENNETPWYKHGKYHSPEGKDILPLTTYQEKYFVIKNGELMLAHKNRKGEEVGYTHVFTCVKYNANHSTWVVAVYSPFIKSGRYNLFGEVTESEWELKEPNKFRTITIQINVGKEIISFSTKDSIYFGFTPTDEELAAREEQQKIQDEKLEKAISLIKENPKKGLNARLLGRMKRLSASRRESAERAVRSAWASFYDVDFKDLLFCSEISPSKVLPTAK